MALKNVLRASGTARYLLHRSLPRMQNICQTSDRSPQDPQFILPISLCTTTDKHSNAVLAQNERVVQTQVMFNHARLAEILITITPQPHSITSMT